MRHSRKQPTRPVRSIAVQAVVVAMAAAVTHVSAIPEKPLRHVTAAYIPAAAIDTSSSAVGIADSDLYAMSPEDIAVTLDTLKELGVTQVRIFVPWRDVEAIEDDYNWTRLDTVVDAAADRDMAVLATVTSTPYWASSTGLVSVNGEPDDVGDFAEFTGLLASRYGAAANDGESKIQAYEVWNEPNGFMGWFPGPDAKDYTKLLKAAYSAIKQADGAAVVVAGVLGAGQSAAGLTVNPVDFLAGMYSSGAAGYFDAISYHPYQTKMEFSEGAETTATLLDTPYQQLVEMRQLMDSNRDSDKLIWTTEYGLSTSKVGESAQAGFIADFLKTWSSLTGVGPVFLYTTRDRDTGSSESEDNFGIFEDDWTPKQAAAVIAAWIAERDGTSPVVPTDPVDPTDPLDPEQPDDPEQPWSPEWPTNALAMAAFVSIVSSTVGAVSSIVLGVVNAVFKTFSGVFSMVDPVVAQLASATAEPTVGLRRSLAAAESEAEVAEAEEKATPTADPEPKSTTDLSTVAATGGDADAPSDTTVAGDAGSQVLDAPAGTASVEDPSEPDSAEDPSEPEESTPAEPAPVAEEPETVVVAEEPEESGPDQAESESNEAKSVVDSDEGQADTRTKSESADPTSPESRVDVAEPSTPPVTKPRKTWPKLTPPTANPADKTGGEPKDRAVRKAAEDAPDTPAGAARQYTPKRPAGSVTGAESPAKSAAASTGVSGHQAGDAAS